MPTARKMLNPPRERPRLSQANPAVADITLDAFVLDSKKLDANVLEAINEVGISRSIDGASTLTANISDPAVGNPPRSKLLNSGALSKAVDLDIDDLGFRLADIDLGSDEGGIELDLTFEARPVARLRRFTGEKHASRADKTRAEFIKSLCDEAGVRFICPDLKKRQPIQSVEDAMTPSERKTERHKGLKKGVKITVKGRPADSEQIRVLQEANDTADSRRAPALAQLAMNMAIIQESTARNLTSGHSSSVGVLQLLNSHLGGSTSTQGGRRDVSKVCALFLDKGFWGKGGAIELAQKNPDKPPGWIAQQCQGSAHPSAYDPWEAEAKEIMQAFGASGSLDVSANAPAEEYAEPYMFKRLGADEASDGKPEDSWTCMRRLADEVLWRLWEEAGAIYYMHDDRILRSVVQMTIAPETDGIDNVSGRLSNRKDRQELTVACQARRWAAPPGTVAEVEGYGKFDGRWIVAKIDRPSIFTTMTTITLQQREKALLEPAHEMRIREASDADGPTGTSADLAVSGVGGGSIRARVVEVAKKAAAISAASPSHYYYSQQGNAWKHDVYARDIRGGGPQGLGGIRHRSDCSTFIIQVYVKAGCDIPASMKGQGFTGTLADAGHRTKTPKPGDICLYGSYPFNHVELYIGGGKTIGHGTAPIDYSTPRGPSGFAGYWTFAFLEEDKQVSRGLVGDTSDVLANTR
jgi:cell wall-associated NlpC family hydrolase